MSVYFEAQASINMWNHTAGMLGFMFVYSIYKQYVVSLTPLTVLSVDQAVYNFTGKTSFAFSVVTHLSIISCRRMFPRGFILALLHSK